MPLIQFAHLGLKLQNKFQKMKWQRENMATSGIIKSFGQINNHNHFWSATWLRN
jgi:hypothetical protein